MSVIKRCNNIYVVPKLTKQRKFGSSQNTYLESLERVVSAFGSSFVTSGELCVSLVSFLIDYH